MVRFRLTGVSLWGFQWEKKDDDRELARRVMNMLANRRMLWKDYVLEVEEHCVISASDARGQLGAILDSPEIGDELSARIMALQAAFRSFIDEVGPCDGMRGHHWGGAGTDPLSVALGRLRGVVGVLVGELSSTYRVEVSDDLATTVPDLGGDGSSHPSRRSGDRTLVSARQDRAWARPLPQRPDRSAARQARTDSRCSWERHTWHVRHLEDRSR